MTLAAKLVQAAERLLSLDVREDPLRSNRGPRISFRVGNVKAIQECDFLPGGGYPWCASTCLYLCEDVGRPLAYKSPGAWALTDHYARTARWGVTRAEVAAGDFVSFNIGSGHVALCVGVRGENLDCIGGNQGDSVSRRTFARAQVHSAFRVPDPSKPHAQPRPEPVPPAPRMWEIVGSLNGHRVLIFTGGRSAVLRKLARTAPERVRGNYSLTVQRSRRAGIG